MARILVTGGDGILAQAVATILGAHHAVASLDRTELDITDPDAVLSAVQSKKPHVLVNCAGFTKVDDCEKEEDRAMQTNGIAVGYLAAALPPGALLVHLSTDYVFDGRGGRPYVEDDRPSPFSAYGRTKLLGEKAAMSRRGPWLLVRSAWLFGAGGTNFVDTIRAKAERGERLRVVDDQRGNPTWTIDLAGAIAHLIERGETGIFHAAGDGDTTWYAFAREIATQIGAPVDIEPIRSDELGRPAPRPADSRLDCMKLADSGYRMLPWKTALRRYLDQERRPWTAKAPSP